MKHVMVGNGTCKVMKETEKAFLLKNDDVANSTVTAWFPKAALEKQYDVTWANGETVTRYELKSWFFSKATEEHDVVMGRGL